jgi:hypothetical protein
MTRILFSLVSDEYAQVLVGGHGGTSGASGKSCENGASADDVTAGAAFVNNLHGLGCDHVNNGLDGNVNGSLLGAGNVAGANPADLHGAATLPNGRSVSPAG